MWTSALNWTNFIFCTSRNGAACLGRGNRAIETSRETPTESAPPRMLFVLASSYVTFIFQYVNGSKLLTLPTFPWMDRDIEFATPFLPSSLPTVTLAWWILSTPSLYTVVSTAWDRKEVTNLANWLPSSFWLNSKLKLNKKLFSLGGSIGDMK